jgi:hypothetical protein
MHPYRQAYLAGLILILKYKVEVMISANLKRHKKELIYISMMFDNTCGMIFENLMESIT